LDTKNKVLEDNFLYPEIKESNKKETDKPKDNLAVVENRLNNEH
jgi:hypothetical protein